MLNLELLDLLCLGTQAVFLLQVCLRSAPSDRLGSLPSEVDLSHFCLALRSEPSVCTQC